VNEVIVIKECILQFNFVLLCKKEDARGFRGGEASLCWRQAPSLSLPPSVLLGVPRFSLPLLHPISALLAQSKLETL